jgi:hypothetical protein
MKTYVMQSAQKALEALASQEPLNQRLKEARFHFLKIQDSHLANEVSEEVRAAIKEFVTGDEANIPKSSLACQNAIEVVFVAVGRKDAFDEENLN